MSILKNQKVLLAILPFSIYITMYFNRKSKNDASTILNNYEEILTKPIVLTLLALMTNIIGDEIYEWFDKNSTNNVKIHLYNKNEVKKGRKMGHVTELFDKDRTF